MLGPMVNVNALGLRGPEPVEDREKIVFLGDSVTNGGAHIRDNETFVALINERLVNLGFQALNAGINNYGPQNTYGLFTLLRERVNFDHVVLVIPSIDFKRGFQNAPSIVGIRETFICRTHYFLRLFYLYVVDYFENLTTKKADKMDAKNEDIVALNISAYKKIIENAPNGVIVLIPSRAELIARKEDEYKKRFAEELSTMSNAVVIVDLYPALFKYGASIFRDDVHFNPRGHKLLAELIWPAVEEMVGSRPYKEKRTLVNALYSSLSLQ